MNETKAIVEALQAQGWRVESGKHYQAFSPDGTTIVTFARTPSDHRAIKNTIARLRRGGFVWPPPKGGK
jgi:hypothetical protein